MQPGCMLNTFSELKKIYNFKRHRSSLTSWMIVIYIDAISWRHFKQYVRELRYFRNLLVRLINLPGGA